jgi:geranylgeranyl pyrophosphate synthase
MSFATATFDFKQFFSYAQSEVQKEIKQTIHDEDVLYALEGGKMLRPAMLLISFRACDGNQNYFHNAVESAVGMELAHSASLVHDDIMDKDSERRGKPAFHVARGVGAAILTGHKMISMAFRISLSHGTEDAHIFLDTWDETLVGQLKDIDFTAHLESILNGDKPDKLLNEYFKIISMKTASLFATACRAGAIEAKASQELIMCMRDYGEEVGIAYQLADDLVDILNGKFEEGIIMPLIRVFGDHLDPKLIEKLKNNGTDILEDALEKHGFDLKEIYKNEIRKHVDKAIQLSSSSIIPNSTYKELMKEAPQYIVNAMIKNIDLVI